MACPSPVPVSLMSCLPSSMTPTWIHFRDQPKHAVVAYSLLDHFDESLPHNRVEVRERREGCEGALSICLYSGPR